MGAGIVQIDWQEINAYQQATQTELTPYEAELIYYLAGRYVGMLNSSNLKHMPPPYIDIANIQERLNESVSGFSKRVKSAL